MIRKKLNILLIILLLPAYAYAGGAMGLMMGAGGGAAASCTLQDSNESTSGNTGFLGYDSATDYIYLESSFTSDSTYSAKTIYVYMKKAGLPTTKITLALCTDNAGAPDVCTNADAQYDSSGLSTSPTWNAKFNFAAGYPITATKFHIRLFWDGAVSGTAIAYWYYDTDEPGQAFKYSADGSSWTALDLSGQGLFRIKDCVE